MERINATARYRELGDELRRRRATTGVTATEVARYTGWSKATVWRIETGAHEISSVDMIHYLGACGIYRGQALDLLAKCRATAECRHDYWIGLGEPNLSDTTYSMIYHESTASASANYEPELVPGLLQTESYVRALTSQRWGHWDMDFAARIRLRRQRILHWPDPARFTFFINERALRLPVGDRSVMHEQLLSLTLLDALPHVAIRVVPASVVVGGSFRRFEFARHQPLVCLDTYVGGVFLEGRTQVESYRDLIRDLAHTALGEGESREFIAGLADEYDRESSKPVQREAASTVVPTATASK